MTPMMIMLAILTLLVLVYLLSPIRVRPIDFDEKDEAIAIYREEVAHIQQQHQKALIDDKDKVQLLAELERKSATSMLAIEQKTYAYRSIFFPALLVVVGLCVSGWLYVYLYKKQSVDVWQASAHTVQYEIVKGLFDREVMEETLATNDNEIRNNYCFLLQKKMLRDYPKNPDALINVAECHLQLGYGNHALTALARALRIDPNHLRANYVNAQLQFLQRQELEENTQKKLAELAQHNPSATDIIYLLTLNHFTHGEFDQAKNYAEKLRPYAERDPLLKSALDDIENKIDIHAKRMNEMRQ